MSTDSATFRTSRTLPFPTGAVYSAFASPDLLAAWWGPEGFTNTFEVFEFQVGGHWVFIMHGPDGAHYAIRNRFDAIDPGNKIVIRHDCAPHFTLTARLTEVPGGTRVVWEQVFDELDTARAVAHVVVPANEQNLDRLTRVLAAAHAG